MKKNTVLLRKIEALRCISVDEKWKESTSLMLSEYVRENSRNESRKGMWYLWNAILGRVRVLTQPVGALMAGSLALFVCGVATVGASQSSLPGDTLYPLKRQVENVRLTLTFDTGERVKKEIFYLNERISELHKVASNDTYPEMRVERMRLAIEEIKKDTDSVVGKIEMIADSNDHPQVVATARNFESHAQDIKHQLQDIADHLPDEIKDQATTDMRAAVEHMEGAQGKTIEVVIAAQASGKLDSEDDEIGDLISDAIAKSEEEAAILKEKLIRTDEQEPEVAALEDDNNEEIPSKEPKSKGDELAKEENHLLENASENESNEASAESESKSSSADSEASTDALRANIDENLELMKVLIEEKQYVAVLEKLKENRELIKQITLQLQNDDRPINNQNMNTEQNSESFDADPSGEAQETKVGEDQSVSQSDEAIGDKK